MSMDVSVELHEAVLYEKLSDGRARCNVCQRRCIIADGHVGLCLTRVNKGGEIYSTIYGIISSMAIDPIEKKPVYHYLPGAKCFSLGTFGCNFRCLFCQNWEIAYADGTKVPSMEGRFVSPAKAVEIAIEHGCKTIAWTYNEPSIWLEYTLDCARLAKEKGIRTVYVTNGYATPEALDMIGPFLDVYRVDLKSFSDDFYRELIKVPNVQGILDVAKQARDKWHMHVEAVTNVIPTWNDSEENLRSIAAWIRDNLGELTPWHITRFFPYAQLTDVPPTPISTLEMARRIGIEEGIKFVFVGNVAASDGQNTHCPTCGALCIERRGYDVRVCAVTGDGRCANCLADLGIVME